MMRNLTIALTLAGLVTWGAMLALAAIESRSPVAPGLQPAAPDHPRFGMAGSTGGGDRFEWTGKTGKGNDVRAAVIHDLTPPPEVRAPLTAASVSPVDSGDHGTPAQMRSPGENRRPLRALPIDGVDPGASITGIVHDEEGRPVFSALLSLRSPVREDGGLLPEMTEWSDDGGGFRFGGLARGTYLLTVRAEGLASRSTLIAVEAVEELATTIRLEGARRLTGRVLDPELLPIEGATVVVAAPGCPTERVVTDDRGDFQVEGIGRGPVRVRIHRRGHAPWTAARVHAENGPLRVILPRSLTVEGQVVAQDWRPLGGARIVADAVSSDVERVFARADDHGTFRLDLRPGSDWILGVSAPGFITGKHRIPGNRSAWEQTIELERGERLCARFVDGVGSPISGVLVRITALSPTGVDLQITAKSDAGGAVEIGELPPGEWSLLASHEHYLDSRHRIRAGTGEEYVFVLKRVSALEGRVTTPGGAPLKRGFVHLCCDEHTWQVWLLEDGSFHLPRVHPGSYQLTYRPSRRGPATTKRITLLPGDTLKVELTVATEES